MRLQPTAELQEITVAGPFAYCWNDVVLHVTPRDSAPALRLVGADLTILRKEPDGRWVVFRAASMLVPE
jgi:ketosteroid isomerase-like protein